MKQRPVPIGMFLCEQVIVEEKTKNVTPVNCFTHRVVDSVPTVLPFVLFAVLTDGIGDMNLEFTINRLDNMDEVYYSSLTYRFTDPLQNIRCILRVRNCTLPVAGQYDVNLMADGELLAQRKFSILLKEKQS